LNPNKKTIDKDWKTFSNWERNYKKRVLKNLTAEAAFSIFSELWEAQSLFSAEEIEILRKRKLEELIKLLETFQLNSKKDVCSSNQLLIERLL